MSWPKEVFFLPMLKMIKNSTNNINFFCSIFLRFTVIQYNSGPFTILCEIRMWKLCFMSRFCLTVEHHFRFLLTKLEAILEKEAGTYFFQDLIILFFLFLKRVNIASRDDKKQEFVLGWMIMSINVFCCTLNNALSYSEKKK